LRQTHTALHRDNGLFNNRKIGVGRRRDYNSHQQHDQDTPAKQHRPQILHGVVRTEYVHENLVQNLKAQRQSQQASRPIQKIPVMVKEVVRGKVVDREKHGDRHDLRRQIGHEKGELLVQLFLPQGERHRTPQDRLRGP